MQVDEKVKRQSARWSRKLREMSPDRPRHPSTLDTSLAALIDSSASLIIINDNLKINRSTGPQEGSGGEQVASAGPHCGLPPSCQNTRTRRTARHARPAHSALRGALAVCAEPAASRQRACPRQPVGAHSACRARIVQLFHQSPGSEPRCAVPPCSRGAEGKSVGLE